MTTQLSENLIYNGRTARLAATPLESYLRAKWKKSPFDDPESDLWRGYVGTWELEDDRLYLLELRGRFKDGTDGTLSRLFPGSGGRVFASWFSGTLPVGEGRVLTDDLVCFALYEREILTEIERGRNGYELAHEQSRLKRRYRRPLIRPVPADPSRIPTSRWIRHRLPNRIVHCQASRAADDGTDSDAARTNGRGS